MAKNCESCRRAFFQSGGYMPCSCKSKEAKPEFVPPPPLERIGASEPNNDSGLFGWCFLHMAAIVACALLLCGILQKLSH